MVQTYDAIVPVSKSENVFIAARARRVCLVQDVLPVAAFFLASVRCREALKRRDVNVFAFFMLLIDASANDSHLNLRLIRAR